MDCSGPSTGPITRRRAKTIKLADLSFENSQETDETFSSEAHGSSVNQNLKNLNHKRGRIGKLEYEALAREPIATPNTNLLTVLDNLLCRDYVFSFLQVNDLLRLRRVCRYTKEISQNFIRTQNVSTKKPLKISFRHSVPFQEFNQFQKLSNPLPTRTSLHVTFSDRPPILNARCTNNITHLTILNPRLPFTKTSTLNFLESFPNITHLMLDNIQVAEGSYTRPTIRIPKTFRNLKSLKITSGTSKSYYSYSGFRSQDLTTEMVVYIKSLVETCIPNLELISLPLQHDLNWNDEFVALVCLCIFSETNLKIEGVTGQLINELLRTEERTPEMRGRDEMIRNINSKIVSIDRLDREVFLQELPNLEKINFENMPNNLCEFPKPAFLNSELSKLKEVRLYFIVNCYEGNEPLLGQLWDFLFVDTVRENVVDLHISFSGFNQKRLVYAKRTRDILRSCPNLKTLYITSRSQPFDLPQLFRGLPRLEKLHFDGCGNLKDQDFIGDDSRNPAFWELKYLKTLEFVNMEWVDVTDDLFSKVLCQMPLKELHLSCGNYMSNSITLKGIKSLLRGKFASTVERLSIENLGIIGVTRDKLKSFERRFRSSQMN